MNQMIEIDGKAIELNVCKPRVFASLINVMIKNYDLRKTIADEAQQHDDGEKLDINVVMPIIGRVRVASFNSREDRDLFYYALKHMTGIKRSIEEFEDIIQITTG